MLLHAIRRSLIALVLLVPAVASAQAPATADQLLKPEQLDALVAPIALYPDGLLAQVLMASTYPLEVVQADRWASEHKNLRGDALVSAAEGQGWDESIKALVATPDVLSMMSSKLDWTQKLGDAVLAQQADVMDAIQRLRARAQANKKLQTTKQQKVTVRQEASKQIIVIEPTDPDTLYVPYYEPGVVYGGWPYPNYPPYYFGYPGYIGAGLVATGVAFGAGYALGRWGARGGCCWGGGLNWGNNNITINRSANINNIGNSWQHNPAHRQGVRYNNANVQQRFGNNNNRAGSNQRMDFRGHSGQQVLNPGGNLANRGAPAVNRPGATAARTNRPGGGGPPNLPAERIGAANRAAGLGARDGNAFNVQAARATNLASARGHASLGNVRASAPGGGGGFRGGGGGARRSDITLKHHIVLLGRLDNGLGFYRFAYNGSDRAYVGVIAQEVQSLMPRAVVRGHDGYLRVFYDELGVRFETYEHWVASGARIPSGPRIH